MLTETIADTARPPVDSRRVRGRLRRSLSSVPYLLLYAVLIVLVIVPLALVVITAVTNSQPVPGAALGHLTLQNFRDVLSAANIGATENSAIIAASGTALALILGTALAWLVARSDIPGKKFVQALGIMPLFLPTLIAALAWSFLASPDAGYLNFILHSIGIPVTLDAYSIQGMIFVFGICYAPYSFLFMFSAMSLMNPDLEQAATVHGAGQIRTFFSITLPLVMPATLGAGLLTFVLIIQNFPVPEILGTQDNISTLPSYIFHLMSNDPPGNNDAAAIGVLLIVIMTLLIVGQRRLIASREFRTVTGKGMRSKPVELRGWKWPALGFVGLFFVVSVVLPLASLLNVAFRRNYYVSGTSNIVDPHLMTFSNFQAVFSDPAFGLSLRNSLITGIGAAIVGAALHFAMAYTTYRTQRRGRAIVEYLGMIPLAVPALVLGLGIYWASLRLNVGLYGTLYIFVIAFVVQFMPQGFRSASAGMLQVHPELEESAWVSGAGRVRAVAEIILPLLRSSIFSTMVLIFVLSMAEVSAAIFLFTSSTTVMSVTLYNYFSEGNLAQAAALSVILSGILLVIVVVTRRWLAGRDIA